MIEDKRILPIITTWAKILLQPGVEFDELISVGYINTKTLSEDKSDNVIASWAKWKMIEFISNKRKEQANYELLKEVSISDYNNLNKNPFGTQCIDDLLEVLQFLELNEIEILYFRFWQNQNLHNIAEAINEPYNSLRNKYLAILSKLKKHLL